MSTTHIENRDNSFVENKHIDHIEGLESGKGSQESPSPSGFGGHLIDENLVQVEGEDKVTWYLCFLISASAIAGFLFGYDTGVVGVALPLVGTDLGGSELNSSQQEIITAGTTIGAIFGSAILGGWGDRLGRKMAILISDVFFTVGAVLIASSYSVAQIIVGRIVLGIGVGGAAVIAPLFITETAPTAVRGRCIGVNAFFIPFGQLVADSIGAGVQNMHGGWRLLFALGAVPSIIQLLLFHYLPESPRILILKGNMDRARTVFQRIYPTATREMIDYKFRVAQEYVAATTALQSGTTFWERMKKVWKTGSYRRSIIAVSVLQAAGQLCGFNTLLYYAGTLFSLLGLSNPALGGLIPAGTNAVFVLIGMSTVDKIGRRGLLLIDMCKPTGGFLDTAYSYNTTNVGVVIGGIVFYVAGFGLTYSHLVWYQAEYLALEVRSMGSGVATACCWIANLVVSVSYLSELETMTPSGTYGFYLGISVVAFVFIVFCFPETKQLSIDETSLLFENDWGVKRSAQMRKERHETQKRFKNAELAEAATAHLEARQQKSASVSPTELSKFMAGLKGGKRKS
ncbi:MFS transporter, SP family, solute carrier family 2 (myo-inositol transporter), member 13 [Cryptococcus deuterogattii 99/473]|uniref:MFS transporter, SP family, solute carrier family 2 (Myo-inositol transporter), member 13 n=1 Tax=Cryptococcus deuterogattii Ram5 TaxID=1296110 RepID=A0A0D0V4R5_9TREE|nr:MFS transporter, SP family, solute carrier family 2 (myo-inositol transporter), member 13 [Cryptococcus deuterogattii Ram5]KIR71333.1 MFS transporter, SP family, solute carrier family 2 (myo-inositol transporter), member 13 [Cryptococcus deuterogattii CA1014]KIR96333.1 MFS transporter, SP family, solute carrier family 2 (myo-inositol transporter), member 13 [Cryptococcus deuterogattii 2001/935-1]KIY55774.1 MFS transporter, SP family, solute carrier family 2 (myo-inositol transporter), member 